MTNRNSPRRSLLTIIAASFVAASMLLSAPGCKKKKGTSAKAAPTTGTASVPPEATGGPDAPKVTTPASSSKEISENPAVLADASVPPAQLELYGVKIGDPLASIPAAGITGGPDDSGLIEFNRKPNAFRIDKGVVASLHLSDPVVLAKLNIHSDADLLKQFGSPDAAAADASPDDLQVPYSFKSRGLTVIYSPRDKKVLAVNVGAE